MKKYIHTPFKFAYLWDEIMSEYTYEKDDKMWREKNVIKFHQTKINNCPLIQKRQLNLYFHLCFTHTVRFLREVDIINQV